MENGSRPPALKVVPIALLCVGLIGLQALVPFDTGSGGENPPWPLDQDDDGFDDSLIALLENEPNGSIVVELHFDRRPTENDTEILVQEYDANRTLVLRNWDTVLVEIDKSRVLDLIHVNDAWGVERVPEGAPDLDTSAKAIRARPHNETSDGFDHTLAVHTTLGYRGEGTVVAFLDSGIDTTHPFLDSIDGGESKIVRKLDPPIKESYIYGGANMVDPFTPITCIDPVPASDHGTHVSSIAVGTGNPEGIYVGIAPQAKLVDVMLASVTSPVSGASVIAALDWIMEFNAGTSCYGDPGLDAIDVLNMSWTAGTDDPHASVNRKITDAIRSGITYVGSTGNSGPDQETLRKGPEGGIIVSNADIEGTVSRADDGLWSGEFASSRGPRSVDDGDDDVHDNKMPHVGAPGFGTRAATFDPQYNGTRAGYGSSQAAPHVSGIAALMLQANPNLRPVNHTDWRQMGDPGAVDVRDLIIQTAQYKTAVEGPEPIQIEETGMFDQQWNNGWGYGLPDAYAAVVAAEAAS